MELVSGYPVSTLDHNMNVQYHPTLAYYKLPTVLEWIESNFLRTKPNARLAIRRRADLFEANISANKISVPTGPELR